MMHDLSSQYNYWNYYEDRYYRGDCLYQDREVAGQGWSAAACENRRMSVCKQKLI